MKISLISTSELAHKVIPIADNINKTKGFQYVNVDYNG